MDAPEWFREIRQAASEIDEQDAWDALVERGWVSYRLTGGERLEDGSLAKARKVTTLVLPLDGGGPSAAPAEGPPPTLR